MATPNLYRRSFLQVTALAGDGFMLSLYPKAVTLAQPGRAPEVLNPAQTRKIKMNKVWVKETSLMKFFWMIVIVFVMMAKNNAADVAGVWKGSMETQGGVVEMTITLQSGTTLTGTVKSDQFGETPIEKAKLEGDKLSFEISLNQGTVGFTGVVSGDLLKLTVTGTQGAKYSLDCKRQK